VLDRAQAIQDQLVKWRRAIHQYPEIGFTETRTAALVADELRKLGLRVETGVGKTGVVGHLGSGSPVVGLRADMDALPLQEANGVPYHRACPA
jgi:amidohydrolase